MYGLRRLQVGRCGELAREGSPRARLLPVLSPESTGAVAGLCTSKVGKRLERRRGSKKGPSLAGRTFQNIIVANYLFQPGFCPRLGFFIVSV